MAVACAESVTRSAFDIGLGILGRINGFRTDFRSDSANLRQKGQKRIAYMLDLDGFKYVNDTLGHAAGDVLLKDVGIRLKSLVSGDDLVARLGGDEFPIIFV